MINKKIVNEIDNFNKFNFNNNKKSDKLCNAYYEHLLNIIYPRLNKLHGLNWKKRSWRILIGPWLARFVYIIFNRYQIIKKVKLKNKTLINKISLFKNKIIIPEDLNHFTNLSMTNQYNFFIYNLLIKKNNIEKIEDKILKNKKNVNYLRVLFNIFLGTIIKIFTKFLSPSKSVFIYKPYFSNYRFIFNLFFKLKKIPISYPIYLEKYFAFEDVSLKKRKIFQNIKSKNKFEQILIELIPFFIPKFYVENFKKNFCLANFFYPKHKTIITSAGVWKDNLFKIWLSETINNNGKLICRQHGGNYGQNQLIFEEKHEIKISDYYLTWGWKNNNKKIIPTVGLNSHSKKNNSIFQKKNILFFTQTAHKYLYFDCGTMDKFKSDSYFKSIYSFFKYLNPNVRNEVFLRFKNLRDTSSKSSIDNEMKLKLQNKFKNLKISTTEKIYEDMFNKKLNIFTYNGTAFLQALKMNFPSIIIFNKNYVYLTPSSKKIFKYLKNNNIFFDSPRKAAIFINKNYYNFDKWWNTIEVRKSVKYFIRKYNRQHLGFNDPVIKELKKII
tara:strand:+ start:1100 stop:2761 length:1662 start_codon:yes stop_codon:yes gene_type:complete